MYYMYFEINVHSYKTKCETWNFISDFGFTSGSCFPLDFGGECSGIPQRCDDCDKKCENITGEIFSVKANLNLVCMHQ